MNYFYLTSYFLFFTSIPRQWRCTVNWQANQRITPLLLPPVYQILHQRTRELEMVQLSEVLTEARKFQGHLLRLVKSSDKSRARRTSIWNGPRLRITENLQAHRRHTSLLPRRQLGLVTFTDIPQTNSNIVGRRTLCKLGSRNSVGPINAHQFILLSSGSEPLETTPQG